MVRERFEKRGRQFTENATIYIDAAVPRVLSVVRVPFNCYCVMEEGGLVWDDSGRKIKLKKMKERKESKERKKQMKY